MITYSGMRKALLHTRTFRKASGAVSKLFFTQKGISHLFDHGLVATLPRSGLAALLDLGVHLRQGRGELQRPPRGYATSWRYSPLPSSEGPCVQRPSVGG